MHKKILTIIITLAMIVSLSTAPAFAASTRNADVTEPASGNAFVGITGSYEYVAKSKILVRINEIRKEACDKGYIDPDTGAKLTSADYIPMKWSADLEYIAQFRAAEATVDQDHTRPNGDICFSCEYNGISSFGENLAWNFSGIMDGIEQWYDEKNDWVKQNTSAETGHYASMISPEFTYIGIGAFKPSWGGWTGVAAEFSSLPLTDETQNNLSGTYIQRIEVEKSRIVGSKLNISTIAAGSSKQLSGYFNGNGFFGTEKIPVRFTDNTTWKSSSSGIAAVTSTGKLTAKKPGAATVTATVYGKKVSAKIIVKPAKAKIKKVTPGKKKLTVKYKKQSGVTGYQVAYKKAGSSWKKALVKGASKTTKTVKKLKSKKKYYVKIRAYKTISGKKYYGAWSKTKSLKVK